MAQSSTGRTLKSQPLTPAFQRRARQIMRFVVLTAVVVFAVTSAVLLAESSKESAKQQARLCAVALRSAPPGGMADDIRQLITQYGRLVGAARLGAGCEAVAVYPESPSVRRAVAATLKASDYVVRTQIERGGVEQSAWGVRQVIDESDSSAGRRMVFLFRRDSFLLSWLAATGVFGLFVGTTVHFGVRAITLWFDQRIADPLRDLSMVKKGGVPHDDGPGGLPSGGWSETEAIARQLRVLDQKVAASQARAERLEYAFKTVLRQHEDKLGRRLKRAEDEATIDPLTHLRNRRFLDKELASLFDTQQRKGSDFSLVMVDLDNFKQHNDTYGHQAGDELLRFVGELLSSALRPEDFAVRYGGDEFVLLLPDTDQRQAGTVTERIVRLFAQYSSRLPSPGAVTLSAGVASLRGTGCRTSGGLLTKADEALYRVKEAGKGAVATA